MTLCHQNKSVLAETATGRCWLPAKRFMAEHIKDDRDLVQPVIVETVEDVA